MSGKDDNRTRWVTIIVVELDRGLLQQFTDAASWNEFRAELVRLNMVPVAWSKGERPPPVGIMLDFRRLQRARYGLRGIDLTFCDLEEANFEGADMRDARLWSCPEANFKGARLQGASFRGDVSDADFTDANVEGADFRHAYYLPGRPPVGLPPEALAACKAAPNGDEAEEPSGVPPERPLRATVTVHEVPW